MLQVLPCDRCYRVTSIITLQVFDRNLDGFISWFELNTTFKDLGMKKTIFELCCIMDENDSNGDGVIDYFGDFLFLIFYLFFIFKF